MSRVQGGPTTVQAATPTTEAPKSNAPALAERVFEAANRSASPTAVLDLGSTESPQRGYRVLAMRLHPDRALGVTDAERARIEEAFKLAKAAWEACPANSDYNTTAADYYAHQRTAVAAGTPGSAGATGTGPRAADTTGGPPPPDADAFAEFVRAQAEAAAKAAEAARAGAEAARQNNLASARMSLDGTASAMKGGIDAISKKLGSTGVEALLGRAQGIEAEVAALPLTLPSFDAHAPDARPRLEHFKEHTIGGLRRIRESLPQLEQAVLDVRRGLASLTDQLGQVRSAVAEARKQIGVLRANQAPAAEIEKWETRLGKQVTRTEELASALKAEQRTVAEAERVLQKLSANVPYFERQIYGQRIVAMAEAQLASSFGLSRAGFDDAEWKARIDLLSAGLSSGLDNLERDLLISIAQARQGSFDVLRHALVARAAETTRSSARLAASLSDDVRASLSPELRTRADGLFADLAAIEAASTPRQSRSGAFPVATRVSGLNNPKLEATWNQQVDFAIDFEKHREEARWAGRDPTRFYPS